MTAEKSETMKSDANQGRILFCRSGVKGRSEGLVLQMPKLGSLVICHADQGILNIIMQCMHLLALVSKGEEESDNR